MWTKFHVFLLHKLPLYSENRNSNFCSLVLISYQTHILEIPESSQKSTITLEIVKSARREILGIITIYINSVSEGPPQEHLASTLIDKLPQ